MSETALQVYLKKVELNGFKKRIEVENKVATGELPVSPLSLRQAKGYQPYKEALGRASALAQTVKTVGWGTWWALGGDGYTKNERGDSELQIGGGICEACCAGVGRCRRKCRRGGADYGRDYRDS
jgi:hypothetical protein